MCFSLLSSASASKQPSSRRIICCPSSRRDTFRSNFNQSTARLLSCLFPPFGSVSDRKFCKKLLCGEQREGHVLPESLRPLLVPWRPTNQHSALFLSCNVSFLQPLPNTPPTLFPGTSGKAKENKLVLRLTLTESFLMMDKVTTVCS